MGPLLGWMFWYPKPTHFGVGQEGACMKIKRLLQSQRGWRVAAVGRVWHIGPQKRNIVSVP